MRDINELIAKLRIEIGKEDRVAAFHSVIREIEAFYSENFFLNQYEVAIFLVNDEKTVLSFACPTYLIDSGMIPSVQPKPLLPVYTGQVVELSRII